MGSRERKKAALNQNSTSSTAEVSVETLEKGFLIKVSLEKSSPGLLVQILEAFEKLGLEVLHADVSCSDCFQLQALGEEVLKLLVLRAAYHDEGRGIIEIICWASYEGTDRMTTIRRAHQSLIENGGSKSIKPQLVKKAVKQAIKEWSESNEQQ